MAAEIAIDKGPDISIDVKNELAINIKFKLSGKQINKSGNMQEIINALKSDLHSIIDKCAKNGVEPFGFADKAAMKFTTLHDWNAYDWHEKLKNIDINISITMEEVF